jgi:hypothetical protein
MNPAPRDFCSRDHVRWGRHPCVDGRGCLIWAWHELQIFNLCFSSPALHGGNHRTFADQRRAWTRSGETTTATWLLPSGWRRTASRPLPSAGNWTVRIRRARVTLLVVVDGSLSVVTGPSEEWYLPSQSSPLLNPRVCRAKPHRKQLQRANYIYFIFE